MNEEWMNEVNERQHYYLSEDIRYLTSLALSSQFLNALPLPVAPCLLFKKSIL